MSYDTDVLVLGSGPGGYTAAFRAADLGKRVTLVERYPTLGGVCLNVGCIPSKAMLHLAEVLGEIEGLADKGIGVGEPSFDLGKMRGFKDGVVGRLTKGLASMAKQRGVEVVQGTGRLTGPNAIAIESSAPSGGSVAASASGSGGAGGNAATASGATASGARQITFESAILAAGSRVSRIPGIPYDDPRVWDSTAALELREIPQRLLVIGGGIIGLELATVYDALGSKVTVVELLDRLMTGCDADLVKPLERRIRRRYEAILLGTQVEAVEAGADGLTVTLRGGVKEKDKEKEPTRERFDAILVAVGRRPNGDAIGADKAGVTVTERGFIPVDREQRTSVAHIFAIGDLVDGPMLAHKASHQGKIAAEVAAGEKSSFDAVAVPAVAYTDPEIAWVGLSEEEAARQDRKVATGTFPWLASARSLGLGRTEGVTKLVFDPETRRLLGAGIVGPRAGDLIAEATLALEMGCDADDLALTIHPHPTLSETVMFAAEAFAGTITDLYLGKSSAAAVKK
jgi:dihydrolipoamide dehydrogenase